LGVNGDFYLDTAGNGNVYKKVTGSYALQCSILGPQGIQGNQGVKGDTGNTGAKGDTGNTGATGDPGAVWRTGSGAPSDGLGINGDYYLDTAGNGNVYKKATGTYTLQCSILGPQGNTGSTGAAGAVWRTGSGVPSNGLGIDGDYYLDTGGNGNVYKRVTGAYVLQCSILGPQGSQGIQGIQGVQGNTGNTGATGDPGAVWRTGSGAPSDGLGINGDYYLDTSGNGNVYKKAAGTYTLQCSILGPQGSQGTQGNTGSAGADGATWRSGSGVPSDALGVNGDFYFDTGGTGNVYKKVTGAYVLQCSILGPQGNTGNTGSAGADGAVWRTGSGVPSDGLGVNGDFYLDTATSNVYKKVTGAYALQCNIKGATGSTGSTGPQGDPGQGVPTGGTTDQVLKKNSNTPYDTGWADAVGGAGNAVKQSYTQTSHGFAVKDSIYRKSDGTWAKARSDTAATAESVGVVSAINGDDFTVTFFGLITGLTSITDGAEYFLSEATAGLLTTSEPDSSIYFSKPIATGFGTTVLFVNVMRGLKAVNLSAGAGSSRAPIFMSMGA
jgi:hypothetical protein